MVTWPEPVDPDVSTRGSGRGWALLLIGVGGAVGTMLRATIELTFPPEAGGWPWATFGINITGAFLLAVLLETLAILGDDVGWFRRIRLGVGTGLLGGFTTYSTFMVEAAGLGRSGEYLTAFGYAAASLVVGVAAAWSALAAVAGLRQWGRRVSR